MVVRPTASRTQINYFLLPPQPQRAADLLEQAQEAVDAEDAPGDGGEEDYFGDQHGEVLALFTLVGGIDADVGGADAGEGEVVDVKEDGDEQGQGGEEAEDEADADG